MTYSHNHPPYTDGCQESLSALAADALGSCGCCNSGMLVVRRLLVLSLAESFTTLLDGKEVTAVKATDQNLDI
jgi:hypothetical protein